MRETKDLIFKSMREASEYFDFTYNQKNSTKNDELLSCYCDWERISRKFIKVNQVYDKAKKYKKQCTREYKYNVGDIISTKNSSLKVLKQIRIYRDKKRNDVKKTVNEKGYLIKCIKDGYEFEILESLLVRNYGCPVCSNRKVIKGINDVATTHPEIAKLFENIDDAYATSYSASKKFRFKCPNCGHVKIDSTNHIHYFGFSCPVCSDGISYPNKFMAKLLTELNVDFDRETKFDWCIYPCFIDKNTLDYGSYDFVISEMKLIIEMDGELGHGRNVMTTIRHNRRKITVEETIYRDKMKDKLAIENGYKIIRIDCFYDDLTTRYESIVENIKKSELSNIFDFERIDFKAIDLYCINNTYIIDAINLWNKNFSMVEISDILKLSRTTISRYLEIGRKHNLCEYNKNDSHLRGIKRSTKRSPYVVTYNGTNEVFSSVSEMIKYYNDIYNIKLSRNSIKRHSKNNTIYHDRLFKEISHNEFNNYKKSEGADLVIGEYFNHKIT